MLFARFYLNRKFWNPNELQFIGCGIEHCTYTFGFGFFSECNYKSDIYWCMLSWNSSNSEGVIFSMLAERCLILMETCRYPKSTWKLITLTAGGGTCEVFCNMKWRCEEGSIPTTPSSQFLYGCPVACSQSLLHCCAPIYHFVSWLLIIMVGEAECLFLGFQAKGLHLCGFSTHWPGFWICS